jgi:hypothetical protein
LIQGRNVAARADVVFRGHDDVGVPGPALLPLKDPNPILVDFGEHVGRKRFEPFVELLGIGNVLADGQSLQPDVLRSVFLDEPFDAAANGEHFLAQSAW